jgi:DinB superfamily
MSAQTANETDLRYPVGRFHRPEEVTPAQRAELLNELDALPAQLTAAVAGLGERQLDTPYRPGGWTVRQVVHHYADSHLNSYVRFRLALTEDKPVIKPYEEQRWAELPDAKSAPIGLSLALLTGLHQRWVLLLRTLDDEGFARRFVHPELGEMRLDQTLALYAWHSRHHVAHITGLRARQGW